MVKRDRSPSTTYQSAETALEIASSSSKAQRRSKHSQQHFEEQEEIDYRGFRTSITHAFYDPRHIQTDACALACCGTLQSDRDRYLLTGIRPPGWVRRFFVHFATPVFLFVIACYGAMNIRNAYFNQLISTMLVVMIALLFLTQLCCKGRWKRVLVRKEVLWRKYKFYNPQSRLPMPHEDDDDMRHATTYLQGQSPWDLQCAHMTIGCYRTDLKGCWSSSTQQQPPSPKDICGYIGQAYAMLCGCGCCHLQVCGLCALAQEARELELLVPVDRRRRIDYVTMQDTLDYYANVVQMLQSSNTYFWWSWSLLSQLSKQLLQLWILVVLSLVGLGFALNFSYGHVLVFVATFVHAWFLVWLVHGLWHARDVSFDLIIKAFTCGFVLVVFLAVTWEFLLGMVFKLSIELLLTLSGVKVADDAGYEFSTTGFGVAATSRREYLAVYGKDHPFVYALLMLINAFFLAAFLEEMAKYLGYSMLLDHPDFWSRSELESAVSSQVMNIREDETDDDTSEQTDRQQQLLMELPFAVQEKTLHSRGAAITIVMVTVALGFACCENLVYVFLYSEHSLNGEISVLIARMLFPLHPICAAIQSIGVVRRDVEKDSYCTLGRGILLPSIIIHGAFDWYLMMGSFLGAPLAALCISILIVIGALVYYFTEAKKQRERLGSKGQQTSVNQSSFL